MSEKPMLKRVLNRRDLLALAWGCMVGWGWIVLSGGMVVKAGTIGSALAFLFAGLVILLVGLVYADFTARIPRAGGELAFCFSGLGPKRSAACGWVLCLAYVAVCSFEAVALPRVLYQLVPELETVPLYHVAGAPVSVASILIGSVGVLAVSFVNIVGIRPASLLQVLGGGVLALSGLSLFIGAGVGGSVENLSPSFVSTSGFFGVVMMTPFLMLGFDVIPQVAEETNVSPRRIGRIILLAIGLATAWYACVQLSIGAVLPPDVLVSAELAPVEAMRRLGGDWAASLILIGGIFGIITSWNACFVGAVRLIFAMGRGEMLPDHLGTLHSRYRTPAKAIVFLTVVSLLAPWLGKGALVWFVNAGAFATVCAYFFVACAYLKIRREQFNEHQGLAMARFAALPWITIGVTFAFMVLYAPGSPVALEWPWEWAIFLIWAILGLGLCGPRLSKKKFDRERAKQSILGQQQEEGNRAHVS